MIERKENIEVATFQKAKDNHECSGDSFFYTEEEDYFFCALADGLGSGKVAKESSDTCIDIVKNNLNESLDQILHKCNEALIGNHKRGSVIGLLKMDYRQKVYSFSSIGNIGLLIYDKHGQRNRNIPVSGYLPTSRTKFSVSHSSLKPHTTFLMFSDGIKEKLLRQHFIEWRMIKETIANLQSANLNDDATMIAMNYYDYKET